MREVQLRLRQWADAVETWKAVVQLEQEEFSMEVLEERLALSNAQNNLAISLKNVQRSPQYISHPTFKTYWNYNIT